MTPLVALMTLTASFAAPPLPLFDAVDSIEHILLPPTDRPLKLKVRSLEALIEIEAPLSAAAVARAAETSPRAVCPRVEKKASAVILHCRSNRIVAHLQRRKNGYLLEVSEARGLPWDGEDGPPLIAFDPRALGDAKACPGSTPASGAECKLAAGDQVGAAAAFAGIVGEPEASWAALRLGDLALAAGDVRTADTRWTDVKEEPWKKLAAVRVCELSWRCLGDPGSDALYATTNLPPPLARDVLLHRARALAFAGRPAAAARLLLEAPQGAGACRAALVFCQHLSLTAMRAPGEDRTDGLALWMELPTHGGEIDADVTAAALAEEIGAPLFAANVLAAAAGRVPASALREHLLKTAELYLAGKDPIRAGVVLDFARTRAGGRAAAGPRWAALARAVRKASAASRSTDPENNGIAGAEHADELLVRARSAVQAARALTGKDTP